MKPTISQKNCRKKTAYHSEARARIVGSYGAGSGRDAPLWPYVCHECGHWHLTRKEQGGMAPITTGNSGIFGVAQ